MSTHGYLDFSGQKVAIIGASRAGIGSAIAAGFSESGADVIITGVESAPAKEDQGRYDYRQLDVCDLDAVEKFAEHLDGLDVLINCAAITSRGEEMDPVFFGTVVDVNLHGTFRVSLACLEHLKVSQGCVINIASMYASFGSPMNPAYGASKAGVKQLTKSLAIAWAEHGIRVNSIAPGFVITAQSARSRTNEKHVAEVNARTPLGRWGMPDDLTGPAMFLASSAARFMTGSCVTVDGGYSIK